MFGHLGTVLRVMTTFDMFNDQVPLRANNRPLLEDRKFRTSGIVPYASNVAMVLYACGEGPNSFALKFFANEQEMALTGCDGAMCSYDYVRQKYSQHIDHCSLESLCTPTKESSAPRQGASVLMLLLATVLFHRANLQILY